MTTRKHKPKHKFGLPLVDATRELNLPLLQVDIDKAMAVQEEDVNATANFMTCVLAQTVTRVCGAERVAILRTVAYVAFPGDKVTRRYAISHKSREVLERFDRGEPIVEAVELTFVPPGKEGTGDVKALVKSRAEWHRNKARRKYRGKPKTKKPDPLHSVVRNGNLVTW